MGCGTSKLETEEAVKRCKARKQYIKQTVAHRHAFAAAHASYAKSLKSTGAALRQVADIEAVPEGASQPATALIALRPNVSTLLPPPHPPEEHYTGPRTPLSRAASMPPMPLKTQSSSSPPKHTLGLHSQDLREDNEELYEDPGFPVHKATHSETGYNPFGPFPDPGNSSFDTEDFKLKASGVEDDEVEEDHYQTLKPLPQVKRSAEGKGLFEREPRKPHPVPSVQQKMATSDEGFGIILHDLDDLFFESYEAAGLVSRLLEAKRDYQHIPFVDEKSGIEAHNKVVSSILAWTPSSTGPLLADESDVDKLASTLDRLHAWEKKLYDEVKAVEATRLELDKKSAQLKNLRGREASRAMEKTRAHLKSLNTRYLVEIEAMDAALSEVKKLRDKSLYPQLMDLLNALQEMWRAMYARHGSQLPLVDKLSSMATPSTKATSESCKKITEDLEREVMAWHDSLEDMLRFQKSCVASLLDWSHLNVQQIESEAAMGAAADEIPADSHKEEVLFCDLCQAWADAVKQLSAEDVLQNLKHLASLLRQVARKQSDEIQQKKRKDDMYRELEKRKKALEALENKYKEKANSKGGQEYLRRPLDELRAEVERVERNIAEEEERLSELCEQNSTMIFQSLKEGLPDLMNSVAGFAESCAGSYKGLHDHLTSDASPSEASTSSR